MMDGRLASVEVFDGPVSTGFDPPFSFDATGDTSL